MSVSSLLCCGMRLNTRLAIIPTFERYTFVHPLSAKWSEWQGGKRDLQGQSGKFLSIRMDPPKFNVAQDSLTSPHHHESSSIDHFQYDPILVIAISSSLNRHSLIVIIFNILKLLICCLIT